MGWGIFGLSTAHAQVKVQVVADTSADALAELVRSTLIGNGVLTGHVTVKGSSYSIGRFSMKSDLNLVKEGLVLSTGHLLDIEGPNDTTSTTTVMETYGDVELGKHIAHSNQDAVSIEFDFIPTTDSVAFYYFFASEEYPEYVGKGFNDAFAFLIEGPNYPYMTNIARIKFGAFYMPITIDNVNYLRNSEYFITNHLKEDLLKLPRTIRSQLGEPELLNEIEFDGMTTRLRAVAHVVPGEIYRLKIVIADVGDMRYDSGVFLEKESFYSPPSATAVDTQMLLQKFVTAYSGNDEKLAGLKTHYPQIAKPEPIKKDSIKLTFQFATDSFKLSKEQRYALDMALEEAEAFGRYHILVRGHTDSVGSYAHNIKLSRNRAFHAASYLRNGSKTTPVSTYVAYSEPAASNRTEKGRALNRRVEIVIIQD